MCKDVTFECDLTKNLGRLWLAYTEIQGDFTWYNLYLLTPGTLHGHNSA